MLAKRDTIIGDIIDRNAGCAEVFASFGMHCVSCPASRGETVEEACQSHDVDVQVLLDKLNALPNGK